VTEQIRISEIFGPTIQGEGPLIGRPTVFVRTAGCDYRCAWCDTLYAVLPDYHDEWTYMTESEILARVNELAAKQGVLISLSGGNPALNRLMSFARLLASMAIALQWKHRAAWRGRGLLNSIGSFSVLNRHHPA
jgi:7-cyano-7-deazaguanosine (preQ0) biosynthesis protein QueE